MKATPKDFSISKGAGRRPPAHHPLQPKVKGGIKTDYDIIIAPIRNRRTFEKVSDKLKELIFNGTFKPGEQLPSEAALAKLFRVGRQSVREALRVLEITGFITTRPGLRGGAVIEGTVLSKLSGLFLDTFKFHRVSLEDCIAARRALEISILESVMKNIQPSDFDELAANVARASMKLDAALPAFEENLDFHRLLAKASKNYVFSIVTEAILTVFADFRTKREAVPLRQSRNVTDTHKALLDAIKAKKKKKAIELLDKDLALGGAILING